MPRLIRDLSKSLNKACDLHLFGEELRVDTSVIDVMQNCFIHLIRNSLDHGLKQKKSESNQERPSPGVREIRFAQRDDFIFVNIKDDGRGINTIIIRSQVLIRFFQENCQYQSI